MEDNYGVILCEYRRSDFSQRLDMFMHYRDLRQKFTEIERQLRSVSGEYQPMQIGRFQIFRRIFNRLAFAKDI